MKQKLKSQTTRKRIVEVSTKLFLEKGFAQTTMQDIIEGVGMSKGAIYHQFKSKEEIMNEVYRMQDKQIQEKLDGLQEQLKIKNGKEKISAALRSSLETECNQMGGEAVSDLMKSAEYILKYMRDNVSKYAPVIATMIKEGNKDGSLSCEYPEEIAEAFLLLLNIWCDPAIFTEDREKVVRKMKFIQAMMKASGVDVVEDALIDDLARLV